jgi:hypothetical protein
MAGRKRYIERMADAAGILPAVIDEMPSVIKQVQQDKKGTLAGVGRKETMYRVFGPMEA